MGDVAFIRRPGGAWVRRNEHGEQIRCARKGDETPQVLQSGYVAGCTHCWIGQPHTQMAHDRSLEVPR